MRPERNAGGPLMTISFHAVSCCGVVEDNAIRVEEIMHESSIVFNPNW
jgi:hypothetical protein